jgi:hypothetical protein
MLETAQIIRDKDEKKFAVISYDEFLSLKELLSDEKRLENYLDYLHIQNVKKRSKAKFTLEEVEAELV